MFSAKDSSLDAAAHFWRAVSGDRSRQLVTCAAAAAEVVLPFLVGPRFDRKSGPPNVIQPAPYTFSVWFPIFAWSLGYAGYQARPSMRENELLRRVGWPLAAAFAATGVWAPLVRTRRYWGAQSALVGIAAGAEVARRRLSKASEADSEVSPTRAELTAVAPPVALLAAWGLTASGVNLAAMLVANKLVRPGTPTTVAGTAMLLGLGAAGAAVTGGSGAATTTTRIYAGTLLWALLGVVIGQRRRSPVAAAAAVAAAVPILAGVARPVVRRRSSTEAR